MNLLDLPSELLLNCLYHLDTFESLHSFELVSHSARSLIESSSSLLHRQLCFNQGFTDLTSCGSSTGVGGEWKGTLSRVFDQGELKKAVRRQRCMSTYFDHVHDWQQLARKRLTLKKAWQRGRCETKYIKFDLPLQARDSGIHRFKLDPEALGFVVTGVDGGYYAFSTQGKLGWSCSLPHSAFPHVEMSDGYFSLMTSERGERYSIWRRSDIFSPEQPNLAVEIFHELSRHAESTHPEKNARFEYTPFTELIAPTPMNATKMRFPYFLGSSHHQRVLYRFDYIKNESIEIDISELWNSETLEDPAIYYVEILNRRHSIIAGSKSITIWNSESPFFMATFPPSVPTTSSLVELHPKNHYRSNEKKPRWSAVHHDPRSGHLVATSYGERGVTGSGKLIWIPDWKKLIDPNITIEEVQDSTVVLQTNAAIVQLAVENERAVFITQDHSANMCALWVLNLRHFTSLEDFKSNPPIPICIAFPLPCVVGPSRLEMTIDEIFVPSCSLFVPPSSTHDSDSLNPNEQVRDEDEVQNRRHFSSIFAMIQEQGKSIKGGPVDMKWQDLNATTLWDRQSQTEEGVKENEERTKQLRMLERQWREVLSEAEGRTDGLVAFGFGVDD